MGPEGLVRAPLERRSLGRIAFAEEQVGYTARRQEGKGTNLGGNGK
jgi:hypothetical protein